MALLHPHLAHHIYETTRTKESTVAWWHDFMKAQPACVEFANRITREIRSDYHPQIINHLAFLWCYFNVQGMKPRTLSGEEFATIERMVQAHIDGLESVPESEQFEYLANIPMHRLLSVILDQSLPVFLGWVHQPADPLDRSAVELLFRTLTEALAHAGSIPMLPISQEWEVEWLWKAIRDRADEQISAEYSRLKAAQPFLTAKYEADTAAMKLSSHTVSQHRRALLYFAEFLERRYGPLPVVQVGTLTEVDEYLNEDPRNVKFPHLELLLTARHSWHEDIEHDFKKGITMIKESVPLQTSLASFVVPLEISLDWEEPSFEEKIETS